MIFFILKNGRLSLQLFLGLLLMIGTIPGPTEGLKCITTCDVGDAMCTGPAPKDCPVADAVCVKTVDPDPADAGSGCAPKAFAECLKSVGNLPAGKECFHLHNDDPNKLAAVALGLKACLASAGARQAKGRSTAVDLKGTGFCFCSTDGCAPDFANAVPANPSPIPTQTGNTANPSTKRKPKSSTGSGGHQLHQFNFPMILAILMMTLPIHGYIKGIPAF